MTMQAAFNFKDGIRKVEFQEDESIEDIYPRCNSNISIESLFFLYNGGYIDTSIPLSRLINRHDRADKKLSILVYEIGEDGEINCSVICPKCYCEATLRIKDYKCFLICTVGHVFNGLSAQEFKETQKIELSKIVCDICLKKNYTQCKKGAFLRCDKCGIKICCEDCKENHIENLNKNKKKRRKHSNLIKEFRIGNNVCLEHKKSFNSYCQICEKDLCSKCIPNHKCGKIIKYSEILPDIDESENKRKELKNAQNIFGEQKNEIIATLNELTKNMDSYIQFAFEILDKCNNPRINYKMIQNIKSINLDEAICDLNKINNNDNLINKFEYMIDLYNKIKYANELTLIYKINSENSKLKILDEKFIENNSNKCKIIVNDKEMELKTHLDINKDYKENTEQIMIQLTNINKITNMEYAFKDTSLLSLKDISKFNMINVVTLEGAFQNCRYLKDLPELSLNTINVKNYSKMFSGCSNLKYLCLKNWKTKNVIDMSSMFQDDNSLQNIKGIEAFDTSNCKNMECMFLGCNHLNNLEDISSWKTQKTENMSKMFKGCNSLSNIPDISNWNISNVKNINEIFCGCESLISLPDISNWNTENIKKIQGLFYGCSTLTTLPDISKWKLNNINSLEQLFAYCSKLISLPDIDKWNISNVENMNEIFLNCENLFYLPDISDWNTSNVKNMNKLFSGCKNLTYLPDISKWNTDNVITMNSLFSECLNLISLPDINLWNITNVQNMTSMFYNCYSLISLPDISKWDVSNIISMRALFCGCKKLEDFPDLSNWNMRKVNDISWMFYNCDSLNSFPDINKWNINKNIKKFKIFWKKSKEIEKNKLGINLFDIKNINIRARQFCIQTGIKIPSSD